MGHANKPSYLLDELEAGPTERDSPTSKRTAILLKIYTISLFLIAPVFLLLSTSLVAYGWIPKPIGMAMTLGGLLMPLALIFMRIKLGWFQK